MIYKDAMNTDQQEIEAKFYIQDLARLKARLVDAGAQCIHERVLEINLRFDTPDRQLSRGARALRLRHDTISRLTYKGPADPNQPISVRKEIEFEVSDFQAAKDFLEALGYGIFVHYEKFRTTYRLDDVEVLLDEMPYGTFAEIEGGDIARVQKAAERLNLRWDTSSRASYLVLFEQLVTKFNLGYRNLSFAEFEGTHFTAADLGLVAADN